MKKIEKILLDVLRDIFEQVNESLFNLLLIQDICFSKNIGFDPSENQVLIFWKYQPIVEINLSENHIRFLTDELEQTELATYWSSVYSILNELQRFTLPVSPIPLESRKISKNSDDRHLCVTLRYNPHNYTTPYITHIINTRNGRCFYGSYFDNLEDATENFLKRSA